MTNLTIRQWERTVWALFSLSLLLFVFGFFAGRLRLWGVSLWTHFSPYTLLIAVVAVISVGFLLSGRLTASHEVGSDNGGGKTYLYFGVVITLLLMAAFYFFRNEIHFLGDGNTLLANLAADNPIIKERNYGEALLHQLAYSLTSGESSQRALLAYQMVSWLGGLAFILTTLTFARRLFQTTIDHILFVLGMLGGGYMLLFFGYAEHYSLFVTSVAWFALTGLTIAVGRMNRWYIIPPLVVVGFMHIFGLILVPAAIYLLIAGTNVSAAWLRLRVGARTGLIVISLAVAAFVLYRAYTTDYFFRFALVPIVEDRFTLEGYTMFSLAHLADIGNLIILLFPGIVMVIGVLFFLPLKKMLRQRDYMFLLVMLVSFLAAVMLFDPKLGMPRDWDLFSFFGVPLVLTGYYVLIKAKEMSKVKYAAVLLSVLVGFFALVPRVTSQAVPNIGVLQVIDYARLDMKKSLFLIQHIGEYYLRRGDFKNSPLADFNWERYYPEWGLINSGLELRRKKESQKAIGLFRQSIRYNPMFQPSYSNLGSAYLDLRQPDSAVKYLEIARGLRPYHTDVLRDLGYAYLLTGRENEAVDCWKQVIAINPSLVPVAVDLLKMYAARSDKEDYVKFLIRLAEREDLPASVYKRLGDYYASQEAYDKATAEYRRAVAHGLPPEELEEVYRQYPKLPRVR